MTMPRVLLAGVVLGVVYTLSPLTVLCLAALVAVTRWAGRDLTGREREWFFALVTFAILSRLVLIAGLFLFADPSKPYATFFGDEEIFKSRPIWLRNVGLGLPISTADFIYAFDETGMSGHLYVLAYLQALVGDAPYGVHIFNASLYVSAALILYRLVHPSFGRLVAFGGAALLLLLPSLFSWSISALKEPTYTLLAVIELCAVLAIVRAPKWPLRLLAVASVVVLAIALEGLRKGTLVVAALGSVVGLASGLVVTRPRLLLGSLVVVPVALLVALNMPAVQDRMLAMLRESARYHAGHVWTPGVSYQVLAPHYYDWPKIQEMPGRDALAFTTRAIAAYVVEPLPQTLESRRLLAYMPEQIIWLAMIALLPLGAIAGLRRDAMLTCVLLAHAVAAMMLVALTSGNVGTLIRHRGLAVPYIVWLSGLGAYELIGWLMARATPAAGADRNANG